MDYKTFLDFEMEDYSVLFVVTRGIGHWDDQMHEIRPDGKKSFQWIYSASGEGELHINGVIYTIRENQGMFIYPDTPFEYYATKKPWETYWVFFEGRQLLYSFLNYIGLSRTEVLTLKHPDVIPKIMTSIYDTAISESPNKKIECALLAHELLIALYKYAHVSNDPHRLSNEHAQRHTNKLKPVFEYIDNHYFKVITIDELADVIGVTPQHLCLLFRRTIGISPLEYVIKTRLERAKDIMLKNPLMNIRQVAEAVGFDNLGHFYSMFKKQESLSPGAFRKLYYGKN